MVEVVLVVEDIDRSVAVYQDTLGLDPISPPELPVKFLRIGAARDGVPQQVVLIPRPMAAEQPLVRTRALHHIGLEVAPQNYEHERERLTGLGSRSAAESTRSCLSRRSISTIRMATRSRSRPGAGSPPGFGVSGGRYQP